MSTEQTRLTQALLLSLVFHALLLSLTFGGQGLGLPGFGLPWQDRRVEAPDLQVVLLPAPVPAAEPLPSAGAEQPVAAEPGVMTVVNPAPPSTPAPLTAAAITPPTVPKQLAISNTDAAAPVAPAHPVAPVPQMAAAAPTPVPVKQPAESVSPPMPSKEVIALAQPDESTWTVPAAPTVPEPAIVPAPSASNPQTAMPPPRDAGDAEQERALEQAKLDRAKQDAQRKAEQLEAERQALAQQEAAKQEAVRKEAARQEAARAEATRVEAERQEAAKQAAAKQEAARQEATRQEATRAEAARVDAERQAAARQEAARQAAANAEAARGEAARLEAGRVEAARLAALQADAEKREERLRAIGRQLNEEADRRDAAARLSPAWSGGRRARLFGHTDANAELILYAEAWSRKIHLNMTFDMVREAAKQRHTDPLVTVAIRSDGSVESVTFVRSSGVPALDEAIRRVVHSQANYQAFPPGLASEYDVVEIRRTWHFDMAIRLQ